MARRVEIDSELRRCEAELRGMLDGDNVSLGVRAEFRDDGTDVLNESTVTLYFVTREGKRIPKQVPLLWETDAVKAGPQNKDGEADPLGAIQKLKASGPFGKWRYNIDSEFNGAGYEVNGVVIQHIDYFGPRIGFVQFKVLARFNKKNRTTGLLEWGDVPAIVFCRGAAVALLVVIKVIGARTRYTVLVKQPRMAAGSAGFLEIPAGMLDESNDFSGVAAKELKEETGITVDKTRLVDLTTDFYGGLKYDGLHPSVGGCDEVVRFFLYETEMTADERKALNGKCTGEFAEGENIKLKVVPLRKAAQEAPDMKTLTALYLYDQYNKKRNPTGVVLEDLEPAPRGRVYDEDDDFGSYRAPGSSVSRARGGHPVDPMDYASVRPPSRSNRGPR